MKNDTGFNKGFNDLLIALEAVVNESEGNILTGIENSNLANLSGIQNQTNTLNSSIGTTNTRLNTINTSIGTTNEYLTTLINNDLASLQAIESKLDQIITLLGQIQSNTSTTLKASDLNSAVNTLSVLLQELIDK